jgi:hypothetical protein
VASELKVDTISEKTTASGVTIDGVLVKDGEIASSYISGLTDNNDFVLLATGTASASADITLDNFVDTTNYVSYKVIAENIRPATDGQQFRYYFRTGGASGSDISSNYSFAGVHTSGFESSLSFGTGYGYPFSGVSNAAGEELSWVGEFCPNLGSSGDAWFKTDGMYVTDSGGANRRNYIWIHAGTTQVTGLKFFMGSGNITSGSIYVFGQKKV